MRRDPRGVRRLRYAAGCVVLLIVGPAAGCLADAGDDAGSGARTPSPTASATRSPTGDRPDEERTPVRSPRSTEHTPRPTSPPDPVPVRFRAADALQTIRRLAGEIGPREATTPAYRTAARVVEGRLRRLGYGVRRQQFRVPEGVSWGVPVPAGRTWNVVAAETGFEAARPHLVVGAHLDTVPQAPGAEDNASGVAVLLELAAMAAEAETRLPVVFVAFGAEEPRGEGDAMHHFGSQTMVRRMSPAARSAVHAMVSLDRVGVGAVVPACTGGLSPPLVRAALVAAGRSVGVPTQVCADNQASDHWSFEKAGVPAARLGSTPYVAYHSPDDLPGVVRRDQLDRVGRLMWEWMRE